VKITKTKLKQLIKEELSAILEFDMMAAARRDSEIVAACNSYWYGEAKGDLKKLAQELEALGVDQKHLSSGDKIEQRCKRAFQDLKDIGAFMEGELADKKWKDNPRRKPGQLTAHQQGRQDALDGKEANPPEEPMQSRDYMVGYNSAKDD